MSALAAEPRVVFEVTALAKLSIFGPVIRTLRERYGIPSRVLVSAEAHNLRTDRTALERWDVEYLQLMPVSVGAYGADWLLVNLWQKRNAGRLLRSLNARVLVEPNDRTYPHHYHIDAANRLGLPTLLIQESLRKDESMRMTGRERLFRQFNRRVFGIDSRLKKYGQGGCARIAAWGQTSMDYFVRVGVPPERVVITGNPALDDIAAHDWGVEAGDLADRLGIRPDDRVVVFLTSPLAKMGILALNEQQAHTRDAVRAFRGVKADSVVPEGWKLVVKPHPLENSASYEAIVEGGLLDGSVTIGGNADLYPLLHRANAVLTFSTTAALEAALFGRPVGLLDVGRALDNWGFAEQGVGVSLGRYSAVAEFIRIAASTDAGVQMGRVARENARKYVQHVGNATDNVARLIAEAYREADR